MVREGGLPGRPVDSSHMYEAEGGVGAGVRGPCCAWGRGQRGGRLRRREGTLTPRLADVWGTHLPTGIPRTRARVYCVLERGSQAVRAGSGGGPEGEGGAGSGAPVQRVGPSAKVRPTQTCALRSMSLGTARERQPSASVATRTRSRRRSEMATLFPAAVPRMM